ncbi:endonuclease [Mucilaginibacter limnophilus]|uniref:Endonuclease n=1 Tax=Mucilaginibacter limnophilus TaxID=1932778 RepID=A0A437MUE8_9SPHI|nr:endonuclease/exonuclease/phosphatase family protein [Mucilaginibacter limnophilus]RVU01253.1 endonuclease [Mucilaginibacter limnophilus]
MRAKPKKINFLERFLLWTNYLLCAALLISYLAPVVNPEKFWPLAFFGLAYPPILLLNMLAILYWVLRRKIYFFLSLVTILAGYHVLFNNIGFRFSSSKANPEAIRIMTYNAHSFKPYGYNNDIATKQQMLQLVDDQQPDIISFQEFFTKKRGEYALLDSMKKIMKSSYYYFKPFHSSSAEEIGMAIFSKFPIENTGLIKLTDHISDNQCLFVDVKRNGKLFRIYNVHLQSIRFGPEDYKYLDTVSQKGKTNYASSRRLGSKLKQAFIRRSRQVFMIKQHASSCPHPYIINGDFNDTPSSFAVNTMAKGIKNAFREKGAGLGRTYNGNFPNYQIDYIMASNDFDFVNYRIIEKKLSDHYPLYSEVVLHQ